MALSLRRGLQLLAVIAASLQFSRPEIKILQLTDLHYGEGEQQDLQNNLLVSDLLDWEKPDLVVVTGDLVSGYRWQGQEKWFESLHAKFVQAFEARNIPWAYVLGNHDAEGDLNGAEIVELDRRYSLSLMGEVRPLLPHSSNYYVTLRYGQSNPLVLWLLDTGSRNHCGLHGYDCLHPAQLEWQRDTHKAMEDATGGPINGLAFMHIPPPEFIDLWNSGNAKGHRHETVACWGAGRGTFSTMTGLIGLGVGHDHFNDYEGLQDGVKYYYGRKTGYGGTGPGPHFDRGARVFTYNFETSSLYSWIRTEAGKVYRPKQEQGLGHHVAMCAESTGYSLAVHYAINTLKFCVVAFLVTALVYSAKHLNILRSKSVKDQRFVI